MAAERALQTPTPYELVVVHKTDSARAHAERLAAQGADEGTLVWAKSQYEGLGRNHRHWMSGYRNLHLALIVKPEQGFDTVCQLSLVATICTALAIAEQAEPMEELRYRWPNDVLLNRGKVAGLTEYRGRPALVVSFSGESWLRENKAIIRQDEKHAEVELNGLLLIDLESALPRYGEYRLRAEIEGYGAPDVPVEVTLRTYIDHP